MCAEHDPSLPSTPLGIAQRVLIAPIRFYQRFISPMTPPSCRYYPTCSQYTLEAIQLWGIRGAWMGFTRILRCHPFHPGGYDPVPRPPWLADDESAAAD